MDKLKPYLLQYYIRTNDYYVPTASLKSILLWTISAKQVGWKYNEDDTEETGLTMVDIVNLSLKMLLVVLVLPTFVFILKSLTEYQLFSRKSWTKYRRHPGGIVA